MTKRYGLFNKGPFSSSHENGFSKGDKMNGGKLWGEIEDFLYDYDDGKNYCDTYIDVKYNTTAITAFLESKIEEIKNERAR